MSNKRTASNELTHDNWDQDYEPEEAGTFNKASEEVLKKRVFKTAKRRIQRGPDEGSMNVFNPAVLANFGAKPTQPPGEMFGFLSKIQPKTNGTSETEDKSVKTTGSQFSFGTKTIEKPTVNPVTFPIKPEQKDIPTGLPTFSFGNPDKKNESPKSVSLFTFSPNTQKPTSNNSEIKNEDTNLDNYYAKLKGLNQSVAKWINKHVETNPLINLQPIFEDYQKFFNDIEKDRKVTKTEEVKTVGFSFKPQTENKTESAPLFQFGTNTSKPNEKDTPPIPSSQSLFQFGTKTTSEKEATPTPSSSFTFGATNVTTSEPAPKFTFTNTPFSFGSPKMSATPPQKEEQGEEESDEPPKVEVKQVEEEGHVYTIRCKIFIKKDGTYVEKGVGSLFLKPVPESSKMQLIVRAHNSLGNVLCNFILSKSIPTQRSGKNNVMVVCIPTPECQPPPVPVLIRVKTEEDADQLLETLEKHKQ